MHKFSRYLRIIRRWCFFRDLKRRALFGQRERKKNIRNISFVHIMQKRFLRAYVCVYICMCVCVYGVSPRPLQIVCAHACHISLEDNHDQNATPRSARARSLARCKYNLPPPRRVHLSVIRMPIARLKNDYGHERRCVAVRHNAILSILARTCGGKSFRNESASVFMYVCNTIAQTQRFIFMEKNPCERSRGMISFNIHPLFGNNMIFK